jgi:hypothetical protein
VLLKLHSDVIPVMTDPALLADFLTHALGRGGLDGMLALHGIFVLVTRHGLEYPAFYARLYQLLTPGALRSKHRWVARGGGQGGQGAVCEQVLAVFGYVLEDRGHRGGGCLAGQHAWWARVVCQMQNMQVGVVVKDASTCTASAVRPVTHPVTHHLSS